MSGLPFFNCYPSDFLSGMAGLDAEEIGVYWVITLLIYDRGGECPNDIDHIAWRCRLSKKRARTLIERLISAGKLDATETGFTNKRAKKEIEKRQKSAEISRENGKGHRPKSDSHPNNNSNLAKPAGSRKDAAGNLLPEARNQKPVSKLSDGEAPAQIDADYARLQAEIAQAFAEIGNVIPPHPGRARVWLSNGFTADLIISVIREGLARKPDISNLSYFDNRLREAAETKPAEPTAKPVYKPEEVFTDEVWGRAITGWKRTKHWSYGKWSLPPDMPGCKIPQHVLAAHGYGRVAA
jgi:uncharacterized protein YdaU (DUF1376 family)